MCSIYTSFPETAEAMLYYQCTIIIATTTNHTIRTLSKSSLFMIHGIYFACAHCLTHYNDKQEQYLRLQQIITSVLVIHINCCPAKPDIASTSVVGILFHDVGVRMIKEVDHFGDCFIRVRPINRLFSCKYRTFGQIHVLSLWPFTSQ